MRFDYFDMLSGEPIYLQDVGHLRSPLLHELCPNSGIGYDAYNLYLNLLSWDKKHLLKYVQLMQYGRSASKLQKDIFNAFDIVTLLPQTRELYRGALSFFIVENLIWDETDKHYIVMNSDEVPKIVGEINRDNFEEVRKAILQFNYIGLEQKDTPLAHSTGKAEELWNKAQSFLNQQGKASVTQHEHPEYHLGNVVSKVCVMHPSYNLLNVYSLTVFQLYDAFFQIGYTRMADLNERIFSIHGGDNFNSNEWLRPILKNM